MPHLTFNLEHVPAPTGAMLVATDEEGSVRALDWEDYEARMHRHLRLHYGANNVTLIAVTSVSAARRSGERYLEGDLLAIDNLPVKTGGTAFQREVWAALRAIPAGQTVSYGAMALRLDRPKTTRAVGVAIGANPVGVVVPCHRVIGADASLRGYGGGLKRKRWLLEHEGVRLPLRRRNANRTIICCEEEYQ
jgi:methylated-DNA-[protein]-cysteine S-methyltransferase